jgi:integrase
VWGSGTPTHEGGRATRIRSTTCATPTRPSRSQPGCILKFVSERLGHASIVITLDAYSHSIPAMQEEAACLMASLAAS